MTWEWFIFTTYKSGEIGMVYDMCLPTLHYIHQNPTIKPLVTNRWYLDCIL